MELTRADLEVVRPVLERTTSLVEVAHKYSTRSKTIVAVTVLIGAKVPDSQLHDGTKSLYGHLLEELVTRPGIPEGEPFRYPHPTWYTNGYRDTLINRSRIYKFHEGGYRGAHGVTFVGNALLAELVRERPEYESFCNEVYRRARASLLRRLAEQAKRA